MRVLHLSTSMTGGAGIAAERIVSSQVKIGLDSQLLCRNSQTRGISEGISTLIGKLNTVVSRSISEENYDFISPFSVSNIALRRIEEFQPDIVNVHNWFNFLSLRDLQKIGEEYPLVFTMHDARLVTGGCHVTLGCKNFENSCTSCPASKIDSVVSLSKKRQDLTLSSIEKYALVFPSHWLRQDLATSEICRQAMFSEVISNPLDFTHEISSAEKTNKHIEMCFVSATLDSNFKGLFMLNEALEIFAKNHPEIQILINLVGSSTQDLDVNHGSITIKKVGALSSGMIRELLRKSDYLLVPSQSDNFPNVISEAQTLGTIVVATNVGGIPEMIVDGKSGFLAQNTAVDFARTMKRALDSKESSKIRIQAKIDAQSRCSQENAALKYKELYEKLLTS
jgi:glycosyltransferase involved in cell wall biosynthesis